MPLKLIPPDPARRTPYFRVRGTYLGTYIDRSTKTGERGQARQIMRDWKEQIERGEYGKPQAVEPHGEPTFASAAIAYMNAGGERRYLTPAINELGTTPLSQITQIAIDDAEAQSIGWPCVGAQAAALGVGAALIDNPVTIVPRGSTAATAAAADRHDRRRPRRD